MLTLPQNHYRRLSYFETLQIQTLFTPPSTRVTVSNSDPDSHGRVWCARGKHVAGSGKKSWDAQFASVQEQVVTDGLKLLSRFYSLHAYSTFKDNTTDELGCENRWISFAIADKWAISKKFNNLLLSSLGLSAFSSLCLDSTQVPPSTLVLLSCFRSSSTQGLSPKAVTNLVP
ncbi:hypothetical protein POM88_001550 [Heracleum sosnowskyi]|uniref:Uncharacterized protein n=1 Tax=Heracleum sosnowskyi TaxID=360622 RepID=A0AAD8JCD7_9APIA|nr:hypothetical protein POM88_001550 [Heracleum sosnowskyi]